MGYRDIFFSAWHNYIWGSVETATRHKFELKKQPWMSTVVTDQNFFPEYHSYLEQWSSKTPFYSMQIKYCCIIPVILNSLVWTLYSQKYLVKAIFEETKLCRLHMHVFFFLYNSIFCSSYQKTLPVTHPGCLTSFYISSSLSCMKQQVRQQSKWTQALIRQLKCAGWSWYMLAKRSVRISKLASSLICHT